MNKELLSEMRDSAGGRDIVFTSLFGSHNYNMANEHSDKDYKVFVAPSFDDLMNGKRFSKNVVGADVDYTIADIRNFPLYLFKANINFLETLFSIDYACTDKNMQFFLDNRDKIARMNLRYFFKSNRGMAYNKYTRIYKFNDASKYMKQEYGYNVKEAAHSIRVLMTFIMFKNNGFEDFSSALPLIQYEGFGGSIDHDLVESIKNGNVDVEGYKELYAKIMKSYDRIDVDSLPGPDVELYDTLQNVTHEICKDHFYSEMKER